MSHENLLLATEEQTALVTLNRPERRNALSLGLMRELIAALEETGAHPGIRAVILTAAGPVFSSGHDLSEMTGRSEEDYREIFEVCTRLMTKVQSIPQPVIAAVQGLATAAGCQLVASCDLAVASEQARFATPGVRIGLFCTTPMVALTRAISRKHAFEMLVTGEPIDAASAERLGLVNRVVPGGELMNEARRLARRVAEASPMVIALGKAAFYRQAGLPQPEAYAHAKEVMTRNALAADAQEGIQAFLEKRPPCWTGH